MCVCVQFVHIYVSLQTAALEGTQTCQSCVCICQTSWGFQKKKRVKSANQSAPFLKYPLLVVRRNWKHMFAYGREFKATAETLRLIEDGGGVAIISAIKTSGQIRVVNLLFCPRSQRWLPEKPHLLWKVCQSGITVSTPSVTDLLRIRKAPRRSWSVLAIKTTDSLYLLAASSALPGFCCGAWK